MHMQRMVDEADSQFPSYLGIETIETELSFQVCLKKVLDDIYRDRR